VAAIAGEEERHTLETLLAEPVSRARVVVEKAGALVVGTAFLSAVTGAAAVAEGQLADMDLPAGSIAAAMVHLGLLGLVFGAFALALSAATGKAGASRGLPAAVAVVAYVLNGLGGVIDWLKPFQKLSPFYQYSGHDPLANGVDWPSVGISAGTVVVLVALAVLGFRRRDTEA
jgi:ABC-2 type transport system permease protein